MWHSFCPSYPPGYLPDSRQGNPLQPLDAE